MEKVISIKRAKIIEGVHLELEYTETEPDGDASISTDIKSLCRRRVHHDLLDAFERLKVHLAFLSEQVDIQDTDDLTNPEIFNDPRFLKFHVTSFSLGGDIDSAGVTITGQRKLKSKKVLNLNSPFTQFEAMEGKDEQYEFLHELYRDVMNCVGEVEEYLRGKHAPNPQLEIELD